MKKQKPAKPKEFAAQPFTALKALKPVVAERVPPAPAKPVAPPPEEEDGDLLFLVNTSAEHPSSGVIYTKMQSAEEWNLHTGGTSPYPIVADTRGSAAKFELPPSGSLLLFLAKKTCQKTAQSARLP